MPASVLICEDEAPIVELLRTLIEPLGAEVRAVEDPLAAVKSIQQQRPALILLDLVLGSMDGFKVLEFLRTQPSLQNIPVLVISGITDAEAIVRAYELGALDFISKPFVIAVLLAKLKLLLRMVGTAAPDSRSFAHEVRNPLAAIAAAAQVVAREDCQLAARQRLCKAIESEANRVVGLVQEYVSRAQGAPPSVAVDLVELCHEVVELNLIGNPAGARVRVEAAATLPHLRGQRERLKQVVLNLVINAVHATQQGGEVRLKCEQVGDKLVLQVVDSGSGIRAADLSRVFEENFSTHGGGLGLAIVKRIVEEHGGTIAVSSEDGRGTTFTVELPVGS